MPEPLHMQGQIPHYPLNRRLSTQRLGEEKNILLLLGIEPGFLSRPTYSLVTILAVLLCLEIQTDMKRK